MGTELINYLSYVVFKNIIIINNIITNNCIKINLKICTCIYYFKHTLHYIWGKKV